MTEILLIPSETTNAIIWHFREVCENPEWEPLQDMLMGSRFLKVLK